MKNILVTGASGFIGSNLIIRLVELGHNVRAFHRSNSNSLTLKGVDVTHSIGDTKDRDSLRNAMRGCDTVFHTAAIVSFWKKKYPELYSTNVDGTRNVVEACLETGVEKLIHTSSIAALGFRTDGQLIDENTVYNWGNNVGYKYSKHLAEAEVFKGIEKGLNAVIVNPSVVIGPRDIYIHGGQIVLDIKRRMIPFYIEGGMNVVNVRDVVAGHIAAVKLGRTGERYILGGLNLTHKEAFAMAARVVGGTPPRIKVPIWFVRAIARTFDLISDMTNQRLPLTSDLISGAGLFNWYSIEKSKRELGYTVSSIEDAMREAYEWYSENRMM